MFTSLYFPLSLPPLTSALPSQVAAAFPLAYMALTTTYALFRVKVRQGLLRGWEGRGASTRLPPSPAARQPPRPVGQPQHARLLALLQRRPHEPPPGGDGRGEEEGWPRPLSFPPPLAQFALAFNYLNVLYHSNNRSDFPLTAFLNSIGANMSLQVRSMMGGEDARVSGGRTYTTPRPPPQIVDYFLPLGIPLLYGLVKADVFGRIMQAGRGEE